MLLRVAGGSIGHQAAEQEVEREEKCKLAFVCPREVNLRKETRKVSGIFMSSRGQSQEGNEKSKWHLYVLARSTSGGKEKVVCPREVNLAGVEDRIYM